MKTRHLLAPLVVALLTVSAQAADSPWVSLFDGKSLDGWIQSENSATLFAAAGIFLIAACLVGATALFRWIEINYGQFWAFGAVGALLAVIAAICGGLGAAKLRPSPPHFPSLTSRLRVAIKSNPLQPDQFESARDTAASVLLAPSVPLADVRRRRRSRTGRDNRKMQAGLILMATLLGWAATRRRWQARRMDV